jgi:hypothetical protein
MAGAALTAPENAYILGIVLLVKRIDTVSHPRWTFVAEFAVNPTIQNFPLGSLELIRRTFGIPE